MDVPQDLLAMLADVKAWAGEKSVPAEFNLLDYVMCVGTPDLLFGFAELLSPQLVVHEGRHFLALGFSVDLYEKWKAQGLSGEEIQRAINHIHISALFQDEAVSDRLAVGAAQCIAAIWNKTFRSDGVQAVVVGENVVDAAVTFFDLPAPVR